MKCDKRMPKRLFGALLGLAIVLGLLAGVSTPAKAETYIVTITGGANATASGGSTTQSVEENEAIDTVTYTANSGYHFAEFGDTAQYGVTVHRASETQVTVSGTPTYSTVSAVVPDAVVISYPLWVGGTQVTSQNMSGAGWNYAADTNTLALNGYTYSGVGYSKAGIYYNGTAAFTITFTGENSVACTDSNSSTSNGGDGIRIGDSSTSNIPLTISGTGSLDVACNEGNQSYGIRCYGPIAINGGTVTASSDYVGILGNKGISISGGSVNAQAQYGMSKYDSSGDGRLEIGANVTSVVITGSGQATDLPIVNAVNGVGWSDTNGTTGRTIIDASTTGQTNSYKKLQFPAHIHDYTYSSTDATITAICSNTDNLCGLPTNAANSHYAALTIAAPALVTSGGTESPEAIVTDENGIRGMAEVSYFTATKSESAYTKASDTPLESAPTNAGDYWAQITIGGATAGVGYTIAKADETVVPPPTGGNPDPNDKDPTPADKNTASTDKSTAKNEQTQESTSAKKATLTFDLGGGTLKGVTGTYTMTATVGETIKLPDAPTKKGYTFKCWKGSEYAAGANYKVEGDHAFTAEWTKNSTASTAAASTSSASSKSSSGSSLARTGDSTSVAAATCALIGSALAFVGSRKRR